MRERKMYLGITTMVGIYGLMVGITHHKKIVTSLKKIWTYWTRSKEFYIKHGPYGVGL